MSKVMFFYRLYHGKTPLKHHLREYTFGFSKHLKQSQGYMFFLPTDPLTGAYFLRYGLKAMDNHDLLMGDTSSNGWVSIVKY